MTAGMIAAGQNLVRGDRLKGFTGWAAGPGTEAQLEPPALPLSDLTEVMLDALEIEFDTWEEYEARIREHLGAAAANEWAVGALATFDLNPNRWFRLWCLGVRERDATQDDLWKRLRRLMLAAPGRSLKDALQETAQTLGELLAGPPPEGEE